jgi:Tfp pilus assembly protein PilV
LLEVMVAAAVITVGLFGLLATMPAFLNVTRESRESQIAISAARSKLDEIRAAPYPDLANPGAAHLVTIYNNTTFTAVGLTNATGIVRFITEAQAVSVFGLSMDLDNDGNKGTSTTVTAQYTLFPTFVQLNWTDSTRSPRVLTLTTIIYSNNQ